MHFVCVTRSIGDVERLNQGTVSGKYCTELKYEYTTRSLYELKTDLPYVDIYNPSGTTSDGVWRFAMVEHVEGFTCKRVLSDLQLLAVHNRWKVDADLAAGRYCNMQIDDIDADKLTYPLAFLRLDCCIGDKECNVVRFVASNPT